ncbi:hypothetical protein, partial [Streptomyces sp. NPDC014734]|uniref:hypothetical protein n=1 Tax=Streptomyces sp. NPDC014734 TaxID=3364886 RepID=UPI0036F88830
MRLRIRGGGGSEGGVIATDDDAGREAAGRREPAPSCSPARHASVTAVARQGARRCTSRAVSVT